MIALAEVVQRFKGLLEQRYADQLLPGHRRALQAIEQCRQLSQDALTAQCPDCHYQLQLPRSCGHRSCPRCQQRDSQVWIDRQLRKRLPVEYFMITFTLPAQLRQLAWRHQRVVYDLLFKIAWQTLATFGLNDRQLQGQLGAMAVLHTHSRCLDYHPHVHFIVPGAAINRDLHRWQKKPGRYLFNEQNLARVFRARWLKAMALQGLRVQPTLPEHWVVHCKSVGHGDQAIIYLGKYLYRGVINEKNILAIKDGQVAFRYTDNQGQSQTRSLDGTDFLWRLLRHVLPRGFRRARDYGFLHSNSKRLIQLIQLLLQVAIFPSPKRPRAVVKCPCCGHAMTIRFLANITSIGRRPAESSTGAQPEVM